MAVSASNVVKPLLGLWWTHSFLGIQCPNWAEATVVGLEAVCEWTIRYGERNHSSVFLRLASCIPTMGKSHMHWFLVESMYSVLLGQHPNHTRVTSQREHGGASSKPSCQMLLGDRLHGKANKAEEVWEWI